MKPATVLLTNKMAGGANKEITVTPTLSSISVTNGAATISGNGGSTTGSITALGYAWTITPATSNGISVSPTSGTGNQVLTFNAPAHTGDMRTGTFTVSVTGATPGTVSITATQGSGRPTVGNIQVCRTDQGKLNWNDADNSCNNSTKEGYSNWRLPTLDELVAIYNNKGSLESFNGFTAFMEKQYRSNTAYPGTAHWGVSFLSGNTAGIHDSNGGYVRCVRDI